MDDDEVLDGLIAAVDLDGLVRLIDARCSSRDWAGIDRIRRRCIAATRETGRQLWPAATLSEYRMALLAPPEWATTVLDDEAGRFTLGPLSEVAASSHTWAELSPHLETRPVATYIAHERALRGEAIAPASIAALPPVLDIPAELASWEPAYPTSTYSDAGAEHPEPDAPPLSTVTPVTTTSGHSSVIDDEAFELAVRQMFDGWTASSTGRVESVCVEGTALDALAAIGLQRVRIVAVDAATAIGWLAWAGASGGAHGRRRGMALGRFSAWWLLGAIGDLYDDWPPSPAAMHDLLADLRWYRWDALEPAGGWRLQLAVEDPGEGLAWAINAADAE